MGLREDPGRGRLWGVSGVHGCMCEQVEVGAMLLCRVKLAVHRESGECVAVKIMNASEEVALSPESLRKEVCLYVA